MPREKNRMARWKGRVVELKTEMHAIYLACRDPRVPWQAKAVAILVVAYALSPIDLIPDFIPVLGYLDDLVILPLGILLVLKMIPEDVMQDCRKAAHVIALTKPKSFSILGMSLIAVFWLVFIYAAYHCINYLKTTMHVGINISAGG